MLIHVTTTHAELSRFSIYAVRYPQPKNKTITTSIPPIDQALIVSGTTILVPPPRTIRPSSSPKVKTSIQVIPPR